MKTRPNVLPAMNADGSLGLFDEIELDAQFFQLIGADSRWSFGEGTLRVGSLGNAMTSRIESAPPRSMISQSIQTEGDSTVWRERIFQGLQQETELRLRRSFPMPNRSKNRSGN